MEARKRKNGWLAEIIRGAQFKDGKLVDPLSGDDSRRVIING